MIRIALLVFGCLLLLFQQYILPVTTEAQFVIFLIGIILLGVPHGAADLLVASNNADKKNTNFSKFKFLSVYIFRLFSFAAILWFFPVAGNILFILFAAYHFGETDLYQFNTNGLLGKLFIISYGLLILSVILLNHFDEVIPLFTLFPSGKENLATIDWISIHRYTIMSVCGIFFFTMTFLYFLRNRDTAHDIKGQFLVRFAVILFILFNLPMLLGFTFYFVVWHSVLSLNNIVKYLQRNKSISLYSIRLQIFSFSALAILGIAMFGFAGFMFINSSAIVGYLFLGLAVLTAPHMQVMHDMYSAIRKIKEA